MHPNCNLQKQYKIVTNYVLKPKKIYVYKYTKKRMLQLVVEITAGYV